MSLEKRKVMVCGSEGEVTRSRIDPCGTYGKRVTVNSVLCTKCDQWIHGKCSKLKKVTLIAAKFFVSSKCEKAKNGPEEVQQEIMCNEMEVVKRFCCLGDRLDASEECEAAVKCKNKNGMKEIQRVR